MSNSLRNSNHDHVVAAPKVFLRLIEVVQKQTKSTSFACILFVLKKQKNKKQSLKTLIQHEWHIKRRYLAWECLIFGVISKKLSESWIEQASEEDSFNSNASGTDISKHKPCSKNGGRRWRQRRDLDWFLESYSFQYKNGIWSCQVLVQRKMVMMSQIDFWRNTICWGLVLQIN